MYVCICNAIRDTELRAAARICDGDADAIYASLGRAPQCRQCIEDAEDIIDEARAAQCPGRRMAMALVSAAGVDPLTLVPAA